jgi:hypothetical protein
MTTEQLNYAVDISPSRISVSARIEVFVPFDFFAPPLKFLQLISSVLLSFLLLMFNENSLMVLYSCLQKYCFRLHHIAKYLFCFDLV